jgi:hypothetical protein
VVRENQSRRDLTKVAQYEVLGNEAERHVRPVCVWDDRNARLLVSHAAYRLPAFVDRPVRVRDGELFKNANPALRTGLLSLSPSLLRLAVARRAKAASWLRRTSRDKSSRYNLKLLC